MTQDAKILVVDDESVIRELLSDILEEEGYTVLTVGSPIKALDVLRERDDFVILFTDIMMPEMDGIQLVHEAKRARPDIIPIVMTGFATLETARAAVKEGAYDYVLKPFSLSEIRLAVKNALERYTLSNENARLREISELLTISEHIASFHAESGLLDYVLRAALDRVHATRGSLMLASNDGRALTVAAGIGLPNDIVGSQMEMGHGISGLVAKNMEPLLIQDIQKAPEVIERSQRLADRSFVSVPLEASMNGSARRILAVLNVNQKNDGRSFSESDLMVLKVIANHASAALENVRLIHDLEEAHMSTLQSMALLLEAKDAYTHGHSERVRDYSMAIAKYMGLDNREIDVLKSAAALHDIGKIGVNNEVLNSSERLTPEEWEAMRRHPEIGYDVLAPVRMMTPEHLQVVRSHHERIDGEGYPDGLTGDQLALVTRIIVVADAYDAMSSDRAYREALPSDKVAEELTKCADTQFDKKVVKSFIQMLQNGSIQGPPSSQV